MVWTVYLRWHGTVVPVATGYQTKQEGVDAVARHTARFPEGATTFFLEEEPSGDPAEDDDDTAEVGGEG